MAVATQDLETARRTGHGLGVTINDLVLAVVTEGMRDLLAARDDHLDGMFLRTTVPVATGATGQAMGMIVVDLPVGEPDPMRRLAEISEATSERKAQLQASGGDVTGPSTSLWLGGARMLQAVPVSPLVPLVPISVAALSYAGTLTIAVNADAVVVDLDGLGEAMERSFARYEQLAGSGPLQHG